MANLAEWSTAELDLAWVESQAQAQCYAADDGAEDETIRLIIDEWKRDAACEPTRLALAEALERRWEALDRRADRRVLASAAEVQRLLRRVRRRGAAAATTAAARELATRAGEARLT